MNNDLGINYDPVDEPETVEVEVEISLYLGDFIDLTKFDETIKVIIEHAPGHTGHTHYFSQVELVTLIKEKLQGPEMSLKIWAEVAKGWQKIEDKIETAVIAEYGKE